MTTKSELWQYCKAIFRTFFSASNLNAPGYFKKPVAPAIFFSIEKIKETKQKKKWQDRKWWCLPVIPSTHLLWWLNQWETKLDNLIIYMILPAPQKMRKGDKKFRTTSVNLTWQLYKCGFWLYYTLWIPQQRVAVSK